MGVTAGGAGKQTDTSAESDWGGGGWGGGEGGGRVVCQPSTAAGQQNGWGGGGRKLKAQNILSLSLAITFTSEIQVNYTRNQERHFEHGARHSSSCKKSYIMAFYELHETHIFTFTVL
jgi:hypothetical protein